MYKSRLKWTDIKNFADKSQVWRCVGVCVYVKSNRHHRKCKREVAWLSFPVLTSLWRTGLEGPKIFYCSEKHRGSEGLVPQKPEKGSFPSRGAGTEENEKGRMQQWCCRGGGGRRGGEEEARGWWVDDWVRSPQVTLTRVWDFRRVRTAPQLRLE